MCTTGLYYYIIVYHNILSYIKIMEKKMQTTMVYRGYIGYDDWRQLMDPNTLITEARAHILGGGGGEGVSC